ncbi:uncharacterized protein BDW43DRAFT_278045 [Aspergillus alliaceus]|uniref:uncharacterized protein n=1 Tax=Petromyces alliaceus TaxID=209559 RepID=UPI0012A4E701|nr:uncharacterized protein BDW43DRAFT_278045 [Aspergillus alliaceus]KAB8232945.1 hypothetical protein BDW43DRAFT_278045 [Aspergillus alliaceus]
MKDAELMYQRAHMLLISYWLTACLSSCLFWYEHPTEVTASTTASDIRPYVKIEAWPLVVRSRP